MKKVEFKTVRCPECNHWQSKTYLTRYCPDLHEIERYHLCKYCGTRFRSTQELAEGEDYPPKSAKELTA